jgi:hypothetical protein
MFALLISGCKKDALTGEGKSISEIKVYDDNSIRYPLQVVAGSGTLLSAYYTWDGACRFMLTDNNGRHLWTKEFGVTTISSMLAENDGTYTIFDNKRRITIDVAGNIVNEDPDFLVELDFYKTVHVMLNNKGNYFFYGTSTLLPNFPHNAFAFEITHSGVMEFKKLITTSTVFTGCQLTSDGGYLFLGNQFFGNSQPTRFFICKMGSAGVVEWVKYHASPGSGLGANLNYYYTHDLLESNDGNYFCFVGSTDPDVSTAARIYKVTPGGDLVDSTDVNFAGKNIFAGGNENSTEYYSQPDMNGYCSLKRPDGSFLVYFNNMGETNAAYAVGGNQTFTVHFKDDLSIEHVGYLQSIYSDYFTSVCRTSDGRNAAFGYISSFGGLEKPVILISE